MNAPLKKSVHLTNYYHRDSGGISTSFNNLMSAAERHRRHVTVIVPGEERLDERINEFATLRWIPAKKSPVFDKRYRLIMPWQYMPSESELRRILLEEAPDMIEVTDKYTLSMLGPMIRIGKFRQLGRPMLVHFSAERMDDNVGSFISKGSAGGGMAQAVMANYLLPGFDFHIANSSYTAAEFGESLEWVSTKMRRALLKKTWRFFAAPRIPLEQRIRACSRGVNTEEFGVHRKSPVFRLQLVESIGASANSIILLYAGRLSPEKNIGLLADVMGLLSKDSKDFRLVVAGSGPLSDSFLNSVASKAPGKVRLLGHLNKNELASLYTAADVFVHPNPREPFGIAPLEAMASGVPVVAPRSGGILSYANEDNAWLTSADPNSFSETIKSVIENETERRRRIDNALVTANLNTRESSTDRLFATYDSLYEDFVRRRDLFTDRGAAAKFDYAELLNLD